MARLEQGYIYLITNNINNKKYVGQTWYELSTRLSEHISASGNKNHRGCPYLYKAIFKHGATAFTIQSLDRFITQEAADNLEAHYINLYHSNEAGYGYNLTGGGQGNKPPMSEAIRQKISQAMKGRTVSQESKNKMSAAHQRTTLSEESQKKLDASRAKKRKLTMEQAAQIRIDWANGASQSKLARRHKVSVLVINYIVHNKTYLNSY